MYYSLYVIVFQFGWACVQICHLALIPVLGSCEVERTSLTSWRYAANVLSSLIVYSLMFAFLGPLNTEDEDVLGSHNVDTFRNVVLICVVLGILTSILFNFAVRLDSENENIISESVKDVKEICIQDESLPNLWYPETVKGKDLLREPYFWIVSMMYVTSRLFDIFSILTSAVMKQISTKLGRRGTIVFGCLVGLVGCVWVQFLNVINVRYHWQVYVIAILYGVGSTVTVISSTAAIADLIGENVHFGAFIYGCTSFFDKIGSALAFAIIQGVVPDDEKGIRKCYKNVMSYFCGALAVLCIIIVSLYRNRNVLQRNPIVGGGFII